MQQKLTRILTQLADVSVVDRQATFDALLTKLLEAAQVFQRERALTALKITISATAGLAVALAVIALLVTLSGNELPQGHHFFESFQEWEYNAGVEPSCWWLCEIWTSAGRLVTAAQQIGKSVIAVSDGVLVGNIAGMARLGTIVTVFIALLFTYRKKLPELYGINGQAVQQRDFMILAKKRGQFSLSRGLYLITTLVGTYTITSLAWLGPGAHVPGTDHGYIGSVHHGHPVYRGLYFCRSLRRPGGDHA